MSNIRTGTEILQILAAAVLIVAGILVVFIDLSPEEPSTRVDQADTPLQASDAGTKAPLLAIVAAGLLLASSYRGKFYQYTSTVAR